MKGVVKPLLASFKKPSLTQEQFFAYFHKLPDGISVDWKRDGKFIIGKVQAGDFEFMTQGKTAEQFVDMVNDAVLTVFDIPRDYVDILREVKSYNPPEDAWRSLCDQSVKKSYIAIKKDTKQPSLRL